MEAREVNVLLVDDCEADRHMLSRAWKMAEVAASLQFAENGQLALEALEASQGGGELAVDLVLMDINMPVKDGLQTVAQIRASGAAYQHVPVVLWSSSKRDKDVMTAYQSGANAYVLKPQGVAEFVALVSSLRHFWGEQVLYPRAESTAQI